RRVLRDMGVLGSVSAMDGAIAAYMDVFTAVPKTPISRSARPAPPPRAALLPRVADHAPPTRLLPARERIAPPRERVLAAAQLDPDRRALEPQPLAERVLEIALVMVRRPLGLRAVDHDDRRVAPPLVRIPQPDLPPADRRRRMRGRGPVQQLGEARRRQIRARRIERRERRADQLHDPAAVQRRQIVAARPAHEIELALGLALHALALRRAEPVPLVDADHERAPALDDGADQVQVLVRHAFARVEEDDHDLGVLDRLQALHDAELLDRLADARPAAHAGRVDQREAAPVPLARHDDAVARRPRLVRGHETLLADQPVDQRRLADVRPADDRELRTLGFVDLIRLARLERIVHSLEQRDDPG